MQLVLGAAGAAAGSLIPGIGASIGFQAGMFIGGLLSKPDKQVNTQPKMDLRVPGTEDGRPLPWIRGALRVAPDWAWHSDRRATANTTSSGGGKGGGSPESESTSYTYDMDALFLLNINGGIGISEVYIANELVWRTDSGASAGTIAASNASERWDRLTVYTGAADQLPDPDYEAWVDANVGAGLAPAYRGRLTVFVKGLKLGTSGQVPQIEFTVVVDGARGPELNYYIGGITSASLHSFVGLASAQSKIWIDDPSYNSGGASEIDRYGIYDLAAGTWSYVVLQSPWHIAGDTSNGPRAIIVPEWDVIYIQARATGGAGFRNTLIYQLSTNAYLGNFKDSIDDGEPFEHAIIGVDPDRRTMLVWSGDTGLKIWTVDGLGFPLGILATYSTAPGDTVQAIADSDGVYWLRYGGAQEFWRMDTAGRTVISAGADGATSKRLAFDATRNCFYYWSAVGAGEYLKKMDCATSVMSRVNAVAYGTTGEYPYFGQLEYADDRDQIIATKVGSGTYDVFLIDPDDGTVDDQFDLTQSTLTVNNTAIITAYQGGVLWFPANSTGFGELRLDVIAVDCPTVQAVQEAICIRGGLTAAQVNAAPLAAITREVCAFPWSQISGSREPTQRMMTGFFYETVMSGGKVKFVPRGGSEVATIPYMDLGAHLSDEGGDEEPLPLRLVNDVEMPAHTLVKFINLSNNYQDGAEKSDRLISASAITVNVLDLAMGLLPVEGKGIADTAQRDRAATLLSARIWLLRSDYPTLEPTDTIIVVGKDGSEYRFRAINMIDRFPLVGLDIVLDDPNVLSNQGITTTDYESQTTVTAPANTTLQLADLPILQNADDFAGIYAFAKQDRAPYPGAAVMTSANNIDYERAATISEQAIFGTATSALGDWTGPRVFDFTNSVTVSVGSAITLTSSTRAAVLASQEVNAFAIGNEATGWELGQFIDADLVSPGVYTLSRLLRGSRGTEWRMTGHVSGETFLLLTREGVRRVQLQNAQLGATRYYKGVTLGRSVASTPTQSFTALAGGLKPFAPVRARVTRDGSNNATITWSRRTRLSTRFTGPLGVSVPLGEQTEAYQIDFYTDGTYTTLATSKTSTTTSYVFSAADQTAAGLTPGDDLYMDIKMRSAVVGLGYALRRAA